MSAYTRHNGDFLSLTNDLDLNSNCMSNNNDSLASYFLFNIKGISIW